MSTNEEEHTTSSITTATTTTNTTKNSHTRNGKTKKTNMSSAVKDIVFNTELYEEIESNPSKRLHHKDLPPNQIKKVKGFLKPYYKKKMVTKEQWKAVMKDAVRDMCRKPAKFADDENIKQFVAENVAAYLKV